jgi:hypothetical protein
MSNDLHTSRINGAKFMKDPIVEEVRAAREKIAAKFNYNIHAIAENARRHQAKSGHKIIKISRHRPLKSEAIRP